MKHVTDNHLFSDTVLEISEGVLQLFEVLDYWSKEIRERKQVDTIYLDIRKVFDSIPHRRLLRKCR